MLQLIISMAFVCCWTVHAYAQSANPSAEVPTELKRFVASADSSFRWNVIDQYKTPDGRCWEIDLISQTWQDIVWRHRLQVFEPVQLKHPDHILLYITGGSNHKYVGTDDQQMAMSLAKLCGARVAVLPQVPNQPLLGGRFEDDLITDTFLFHLATKDPRWPLLFPMVKSAVKAMDCLELLAAQVWKTPIQGFVVTGASKRGWTTWLTAVVDPRVQGIAPIVIDTLNMSRQMDYQIETWGQYSEQIVDYEQKGLIGKLKTDETIERLWRWVDPYTYRKQLTLPKLIINGTNDRYWTVDALNNYWDGLEGAKAIRYVPNAGHNLQGGREGAMITLAAFFRLVASKKSLPEFQWTHETDGNKLRLKIEAKVSPESAKLWVAESDSKDFRNSQWKSHPLTVRDRRTSVEIQRPSDGHIALFGELLFRLDDLEYALSTQIRRE